MSEREAYLGYFHVALKERGVDGPSEEYKGIAAIFCESSPGYNALLRKALTDRGYRILWLEEIFPAGQESLRARFMRSTWLR